MRWIAAARRVQAAAQVWLFRSSLRASRRIRSRLLYSIVSVQALFRARQPRRSFVRLRQAAVTMQVRKAERTTKGWAVFEHAKSTVGSLECTSDMQLPNLLRLACNLGYVQYHHDLQLGAVFSK